MLLKTHCHLLDHTALPVLDIVLKSNLVLAMEMAVDVVLLAIYNFRGFVKLVGRGV